MSRFFSERFASLSPYVPGEQPQDMQYIKLNTNESPFPPSPKVAAAVTKEEVERLRLYSDPESRLLTQAIARACGVKEENVLATNGSDEILAFCFMAFCDGEREMVYPDISYGFYPVYAKLLGLKVNTVPLKEDLSINVDSFCGIGKNVIIANPNAPTGICLSLEKIEKIVASNKDYVVIIDEAYVDFGGESCIPLVEKYDNLVVIQTLSKSRSLAGGRVGFAVASVPLIQDLKTIKYSFNPYNINRLSAIAGREAMLDAEYFSACTKKIIANREYTVKALAELGFTVLPSKANFIFAKSTLIGGKELYLALKKNGILVRHFDKERISEYVRITIGTREQMEALISLIGKILAE